MLNKQGKLILSGRAVWPALKEPDAKFEKKIYKVSVSMPAEDAAPVVEFLNSIYETEYTKMCDVKKKKTLRRYDGRPWSDETSRDGELTGNILFNCKCAADNKDGSPRPRPVIVDSKGQPMQEDVGTGSDIKVAVDPYVWFTDALGAGIRLTLRGVQVLKLNQGSSGTSESCGFTAVEGFETAAAAMADTGETTTGDF